MDNRGAEKLGARLIGEVEEEGLDELLGSIRKLILTPEERCIFNIPELDSIVPPSPSYIQHDSDGWEQNQTTSATQNYHPDVPRQEVVTAKLIGPVLEFVSVPPTHHPSSSGKTSLLYHIVAHAILPTHLNSVPLHGHSASVIILDSSHHFSASRLAQVLLSYLSTQLLAAGCDIKQHSTAQSIKQCVQHSLTHVHIFQPETWDSLLATLQSLPAYLFPSTSKKGIQQHHSTHRRIHSIILPSIDFFVPQLNDVNTVAGPTASSANSLATASARLTMHLERLSGHLSCAIIVTSHAANPASLRPPLPLSWSPAVKMVRLGVGRVEVLKFATGLSVEEAEVERARRWDVVSKGRFRAWKVGAGAAREDDGFAFRVGPGVTIERGE